MPNSPELAAERAREADHAALARGVVDEAADAFPEGGRRDVDDLAVAAAPSSAGRRRGRRTTCRAGSRRASRPTPRRSTGRTAASRRSRAWPRCSRGCRRGPTRRSTPGGGRLAGGEIGDVAGDADGCAARRRRSPRPGGRCSVAVDVEHGDARALLREAQADRASDAARASRRRSRRPRGRRGGDRRGQFICIFVLRSVEVATHVARYRAERVGGAARGASAARRSRRRWRGTRRSSRWPKAPVRPRRRR